MNILIAMDSFKESLSSLAAGQAAAAGFYRACPDAEITLIPMADGGEGTTDALVYATAGRVEQVEVSDLLGRKRWCNYGILPDGTAVIEAAASAGLHLLRPEERNPLFTTTFGVGQMIGAAIDQGCRKFILGLGGSGTNDGGMGMLRALGFEFLDGNGAQVPHGAIGIGKVHSVKCHGARPELRECSFEIACDVNNPLCGDNGCSAIYGPQKGADAAMVKQMDGWMASYADAVKLALSCSDPDFPGAGAAGGLGFALMSFLNGTLHRGIELMMEHCSLHEKIAKADLVVTGEGRIDGQTAMGKAPWGIARLAKKLHKPVIAFCGSLRSNEKLHESIDACFSIMTAPCSLEEALEPETAAENLASTAEQVLRLILRMKE